MLKSQIIVYKCLELRQVFFRMTYFFVLLVMVYLAHVDGQTTMYVVVTSGTCQSNGHNMISEADKCEAAASRVGWPDTTVNAGQWTSYPTGCVTSMSNSGSKQLHYNTLSWASPSCSISTNVKGCLCEYTGAACAYGAGVTANPDTCACGLSVCTSTTGFFCTTSLSSCSTSAACAITDGSALNTEKCSCGTADCEDSSLCFADENRCAIPNCAIIDGSAENLATCACGSATCTSSTGLFCDASKNSCSKVVGSHTDVYLIVTSGTCQSNGYNLIPDAATCGLAAAAVGWSDTSVNWPFSYFRDNFPGGCLDFQSAVTGGNLKFNTFYGGGGSCNDGSSKACLCSITVPTCPIADGSVANVDSCLCGNTICNEGAGLYCDAATSKCKPYPIVSCSNIDATESNAANCVCGSTDCDEASGLFCDASRNSCHIVPLCTNTVGIAANTASCACGTVNCDAGTGLYCSTSLNQCSLTNYFSKGGIEAEICVEQNGLVINNQPCFCGSNTQYCTLTTGLVCDGSSSTCNMIPACANTNGRVANIDSGTSCSCGTATCDADSGFCDISKNQCDSLPYCVNTDGRLPNTGDCKCGTTTCNNSSPYCLLENGQCANRVIPECTIADGTAVNEDNCACGENDCTGLTGLFCDTNNNDRCTPIEACVITNGTAANPTTCACGANDCNSLTGLFCDRANDDSCTPIEACAITDGTAANPETCACGENVCDGEQLHCIKAENKCSLYPNCLITDGSDVNVSPCMCGLEPCKNHDIVQISDGECNPSSRVSCEYECRTIAKSLQLQFSSLGSISQDAPSGCYIYKNEVSFNPSTSALGACSNTYECICRDQGLVCSQGTCLRAPLCEHIDGITLNEGPCACGLTDCSSASGFVCDFKNNKCMHQLPACVQQEPFVNNTVDCICGDARCTETNGRFCLMDDNTCFKESQCHYRNGIVENSHACGCGDTRCTTDTGLFCQSEWSTCSTLNACVNRNGSQPISNACACGQSECAVGQYCNRGLCQNIRDDGCKNINAVNETQPFLPICAITNGTMANSQSCRCGNTVCDQVYGLYCIAEMSQCSLTSSFFATTDEDVLQTSTYADSIGKQCVEHIHTFEQCVFASQILGITHWNSSTYDFIVPQGSFEVDDYTRPAGCFHYIEQTNTRTQHRRESLYFNQYGLNEYETNDILHRYIETSFTRNASSGICFRPQLYPSCPKQSGYHDFALNSIDKCVCGAEVCVWDNNKMVCDEGQCIRPPPCENTIGTIENTGVTACSCGETHCMNKDRHGTDIFEPRAYDGFYCRPNSVGPYHLADRCDVHTVCEEFYGLNSTDYTCMCATETCIGGEYCALGQCISYGGNVNSGVWSDGELEPTGTVAPLCVHNGSVPCLCGASYTECTPTTRLRPETLNFSAAGTGLACMFEESTCGRPSECVDDNGTVVNDADTCACGNVDCWASGMYCFKDRHMCKPEPLCTKRHGAQSVSESCTCQHEICSPGQYCYENDVTYENYMFYLARNSVPACRNMPTCADTSGTVANDACYCEFDACDDNAYCYQGKCWQYPLCLHTEGRTENTGDCICGQNECTGEFDYCYQGKCLRYPLCDHGDGVGRNDINCTCGQHECEKPYCHGYLNHFCSDNARCVHEDGSTPNDNTCLCNITTQSGFVRHKTNATEVKHTKLFYENSDGVSGYIDGLEPFVQYAVSWKALGNRRDIYVSLNNQTIRNSCSPSVSCEYESCTSMNISADSHGRILVRAEFDNSIECDCNVSQGVCYVIEYKESFIRATRAALHFDIVLGPVDKHYFDTCTAEQFCQNTQDGHGRCDDHADTVPANIDTGYIYLPECELGPRISQSCVCEYESVCAENNYCVMFDDIKKCVANPECSDKTRFFATEASCMCDYDTSCEAGQFCDTGICYDTGHCQYFAAQTFTDRECSCADRFGSFDETCAVGEACLKDQRCGAEIDADKCGCVDRTVSRCEKEDGREPNNIGSFVLCNCGQAVCQFNEYCNADESTCSTFPIVSCPVNDVQVVSPCQCDEQQCAIGEYCDRSVPRGRCTTESCSRFHAREPALCAFEDYGNGVYPDRYCQGACDADTDKNHCCMPCTAAYNVFTSTCETPCPIGLCTGDEWLDPPDGANMSTVRSQYNPRYSGFGTTPTTCCVPNPTCQGRIVTDFNCDETPAYTGRYFDKYCDTYTCDHTMCCEESICTCEHGTAAMGLACAVHGSKHCVACADTHYLRQKECVLATVCNATEYQTVDKTTTTDRQCTAQTVCSSDQFEIQPPTTTSDRQCASLSVCNADQYESVAQTDTSDRQCTPLTVCNVSQYESVPQTDTSDRQCSPQAGQCQLDEYEQVVGDATTLRVCQPLTVCGDANWSTPPTATTDRQCYPWTVCNATEFEQTVPSTVQDRVCQPWMVCSSEEFEVQAPNATVDRICQTRTRCQPHEFVQHNGTAYADVQCARLTLCSATEYETVAARQYSDRVCTECDFEGCIGCRTTYDCAYDTRAKIQNRSACAGIRCERILLASLADAQLHTGHAYRVEGDAIADLILDTPDLTQVRTDAFLYFAIDSEYEGDIVYDGQTLQLQRDCVYDARWEPCRDNQQGCTGVQQGRVDAIVRQPVLGGDACPAVGDVLSRTCEIEQCDIDCVVEWTAWSTCPANCGETGIHYRNATVLVQSAYRGQACPPLFETRTCVTPPKSYECACGRILDGCGVCGGDNATCADCSGALYGRLRVDRCGVCGGDGSTCGMLRETRSVWHEATETLRPWVPWVVVFVLAVIIVPSVIHCTTKTGRKKRTF